MKYNIIGGIFVFLFLTACNPDFNTNQKDVKYHSSKKRLKSNKKRLKSNKKGLTPKTEVPQNQEAKSNQEIGQNQKADQSQEVDPNKRTKNTLLNDLRNLIEKANKYRETYVKKSKEEPGDQYGIEAFKGLFWSDAAHESIANDTEKSKNYRKETYCALNDIDITKLKELSKIIILSKRSAILFNAIREFGRIIDIVILFLYPKKDALEKLEISNLKKLKNSFEKLLSMKSIVSDMLNQLLLDYQDDRDSIKTDTTKLESHATKLHNQILEKIKGVTELGEDILSIKALLDTY
ncbi:virulence associated lipoprotein [Borreliella tanukii]|uniref:virulence associated lipoprotein n=1 Tax=Borreliella tanukii TaxID=56146 RepID=UPI003AB962B2